MFSPTFDDPSAAPISATAFRTSRSARTCAARAVATPRAAAASSVSPRTCAASSTISRVLARVTASASMTSIAPMLRPVSAPLS